jgi:general secretion pathway protein H
MTADIFIRFIGRDGGRCGAVPARRDRRPANGFTLIELLIVLFIIGLTSALVILSIPADQGALDRDAQRFAARVAALRDNAILQSRPMAVQVTRSGYGFLRRSDGDWTAMEDRPFITTNWTPGVQPVLSDGRPLRIAFESTGLAPEAQAIELRFIAGRQAGQAQRRAVTITVLGEIRLDNRPTGPAS